MITTFFNSIILLGALQGFTFGYLLYFGKPRRLADKFLGILLFLLSLASLNIYLTESFPFWQVGVFLDLVPTIMVMAFGPLIYLYTRALIRPSFLWKPKYWVHFLLVAIDLLPILTGWVLTFGYLSGSFDQGFLLEWGLAIDAYNSYADIPRWISITVYIVLARKFFKRIHTDGDPLNTNMDQSDKSWIAVCLKAFYVFQAIWLIYLIFYSVPSSRQVVLNSLGYYPIYVPLAVLIYSLGIKGYLHSRLHTKRRIGSQSIHLGKEDSEMLVAKITKAMEEDKLFLRADFDLGQLVRYVSSDQRKVSHVLNHNFSKTFNALVNYYRIEEVKRRMLDPNKGHLTLSGIAFECGFNSQSTFRRAFRHYTGVSPKAYLSGQGKA